MAFESLGEKLAPLLLGGFFRPLSRPTAAVYIDCANQILAAADDGGQVPHAEARQIIREVLTHHSAVPLEADEGGELRDYNQRAVQFFHKLIEAHWLEPRRVSLDEQFVLITPALRRLLRLLQEVAADHPAELKDFAVTLRSLCSELLRPAALDPNQLGPSEMRQTVRDLLDRVQRAEDQMHMVETLIMRQEAAQRASLTPQETLQRFLVDFHAGEHMLCYDALQEAGLLPRLNRARSVVHDALHDPLTRQRLAEGLTKHYEYDEFTAFGEAERWLARLERGLALIPIKQRLIDGRMADFARLSNARHRYQTEMRGRRPEQVKAYLESAAQLHAGRTFSQLADLPGMPFLAAKVEILHGTDALSTGRKPRPPVSLDLAPPPSDADSEAAREEIRRRNLSVLTPQRAVRFIEQHLPVKGDRLTTADLHLRVEDDFLDLLAVLAFDRGPSPVTLRSVRWRVRPERAELGPDPAAIPRDREASHLIERFAVERLS
ncbi:MAG: hypothetical protein JSR82_20880 [Verrucomicrobia bacterium]|nr:hypothetical protein [Verrucomicrobiota bacterium]